MQIYHYNEKTGEYIDRGVADQSPADPRTWIIPAHATKIAPPKTAPGQLAYFVNGRWIVKDAT